VASIIFGGTTANYFLNRGNVAGGKKVLVYGASGSVGSAAVQFAKSRGAYGTAVCSTWNLALMRTLRADAVLDYTIPGFMDGTERYDLIFETVNKTDITDCVWNLKPGGTLILGAAMLTEMLRGLRHTVFSSKKAVFGVALQKQSEIEVLAALAHAGKRKPVIDRIYPLEEIAAAHAYVDANHKKGNVVIRM
jgi:NADPH:quinone reductase-like Zn-dependent oxidoreductase